MSVVDHSDEGVLHVPTDSLLSENAPLEYVLDDCDGVTVLRPADDPEPIWKNPDPAKRAEEFRRYAELPRPPAPDVPLEFFDRQYLYD
jgi:hypothetical protein